MYLADGSLDMKLVLVKINVSPFQPQQLPQPHTGAEVKDEHIAHLCKVHMASERTIPLHQTAIRLLADIFEQQEINKAHAGAAYEDNDLVWKRACSAARARSTWFRTAI